MSRESLSLRGSSSSSRGCEASARRISSTAPITSLWREGWRDMPRPLYVTAIAIVAPALVACRSAIVDHVSGNPGLTIVSGDHQTGIAGETLASPLLVRLGDVSGQPVPRAAIGWQVLGGGDVSAFASVTDSDGLASIRLTLGVEGLAQQVQATVLLPEPNTSLSLVRDVTFTATITPTANAARALTWTVGQLPAIPTCVNARWYDIWAASASDVFAVGACGAIGHFTGSSWEVLSSGTNHTLSGVWGTSSADVFAVGDSATVLHYDGTTWSEVPGLRLGVVSGIWGSQTGDLFVVTRDSVVKGHIWRYNDAGWTVQFNRMCPMKAIWGSSSSDIFAVGVGLAVRYNGISWTDSGCTPLAGSSDVSGSGPGQVYTVGYENLLVNCTRGGGCDAYQPAVVEQYDGTRWQMRLALQRYPPFNGIWVGPDGEVVVVGAGGLILHADGTRWRSEPSGTSATIVAVTGNVPTSLWALTSDGLLLHGTRGSTPSGRIR